MSFGQFPENRGAYRKMSTIHWRAWKWPRQSKLSANLSQIDFGFACALVPPIIISILVSTGHRLLHLCCFLPLEPFPSEAQLKLRLKPLDRLSPWQTYGFYIITKVRRGRDEWYLQREGKRSKRRFLSKNILLRLAIGFPIYAQTIGTSIVNPLDLTV